MYSLKQADPDFWTEVCHKPEQTSIKLNINLTHYFNFFYCRSIYDRPNLDVSLHSNVEKVLINDYNQAYGVDFKKFGIKKTVYSDREVILSAGSLSSPQILMLCK